MTLNSDQLRALRDGRAIRVPAPEVGSDCIIVRADVFQRVATIFDDGLPPDEVARLIEHNMLEYDADDPLLDLYQHYHR